MKLFCFCLFAAFCCTLATNNNDRIKERRKLREVIRQLNDVKQSLQHNQQMLNTPPENIEDCCCLSALQCFRANMQVKFNVTERNQRKLYNSLKHRLTISGLDFCDTGNATNTCQACDTHPKVMAQEFLDRLKALIQRAIDRLSMY